MSSLVREAHELADRGVGGIILFGLPSTKDATGSQAWAEDGIIQLALRQLRDEFGDDVVLLGRQGDEEITAEEWARRADTITWEILCGIGARVPRVLVD